VRIETESIFTNPGGAYRYISRTHYTQKALYLSVDKAGVYQYKLLNNEPPHPLSEDLYEYPMVHRGNLIFLSNEARLTKDNQVKVPQLRLSFSTFDTGGNTIKLAEFDASNTIFYPPNQVAANEYLGLYTNFITKKQGIAFWSVKDNL
jgi:hypothetical protein